MPFDPDLLSLAHAVLRKQRHSAWDSRGTPPKEPSQAAVCRGTAELSIKQSDNPTVPLSPALGSGTAGHPKNPGTPRGTVAGLSYVGVLATLRSERPELVETDRWQQAVRDADCFLPKWVRKPTHSAGRCASCSVCTRLRSARRRPFVDYRATTARG
jgi:hypothetical protein